MNDEQVARRVIRTVIQRARRMRYSIELLISPDDARALLRAWHFAEESGIQFVGDGIVVEGTRFRISPQMSDGRRRAPACAPQALSHDLTFAHDFLASAPAQEPTASAPVQERTASTPAQERISPEAAERLAA